MKVLLSILFFLCQLLVFSQSATQVFEKAKDDYYNFQYTDAIGGFSQTRDYYANRSDKERLLKSYYYLMMSYFEQGNIGEALDNLFAGSDIAIAAYGEESAQAADFYIGYGKYYHSKEVYDTAKMFYRGALDLKDARREPVIVGEIYANLGYACDYKGEYDSALIFYKKAVVYLEQSLGLYHTYTGWVYGSMPYVASHSGNYKEEVTTAQKSLEITLKVTGSGNEDHFLAIKALAIAYEHLGDAQNQKKYFEQAQLLCEKIYGKNSEEYATALTQLGNAYSALNKVTEAVGLNKQSYELRKKLLGEKHPETLSILRNIGNVYYDAGRYVDAQPYYQQNLEMQTKIHGKKSSELIQPLNDVAQVLENMGKFDDAEQHLRQALSLKEKYSKKDLPDSYISLARIQDKRSQPKESLDLLDKALMQNLQNNNGDLETEAFIKNNMATVYRKLGEYDKAINYLQSSLEIRKKLFGDQSAKVAQVYSNMGSVYQELARWDEAEQAFLKVLSIELDYYGAEHPQVGGTFLSLANVMSGKNLRRAELNYLDKAEEIYLNANGPEFPDLVKIYNNKIGVYRELYLMPESQKYLDLHRDLVLKIYGKESEFYADNLNQYGIILLNKGQINLALENLIASAKIYESIYPEGSLDLAVAYNNIGLTYLEFNELSRAHGYLNESLRIYKKLVGEQHPSYISTKVNLGLLEFEKSNYQKSIDIYMEAIKLGLEGSIVDSLEIATIYQNLAVAYSVSGNKREAITQNLKGLEIRKAILGKDNILTADFYINLGSNYEALKEYPKALENLNYAEKVYLAQPDKGEDVMLTKLYLNYADVSAKLGDLEKAISYVNKSAEINIDEKGNIANKALYFMIQVKKVDFLYLLNQQTAFASYLTQASKLLSELDQLLMNVEQELLNEEDRLKFSIYKSIYTSAGVKISIALYNQTHDENLLDKALYYSERSKANTLIGSMQENRIKDLAGVDKKLIMREKELIFTIQAANDKLFKMIGKNDQEEESQNLKKQLFALNREYEDIKTQLQSNPKYQQLKDEHTITSIEEIRNTVLREGEAAIEYAVSDSTLVTFLITKNETKVFFSPYQDKLDTLCDGLRRAYTYKSDFVSKAIAKKLYKLILADVEEYITDNNLEISSLVIIPEGPFSYIPFEAFNRNGKYLIEDYDIRYSYSLTLASLLNQTKPSVDNKSLLAFAPIFSDPSINTMTMGARDVFMAARSVSGESMRGFSTNGNFITALPGTKVEVDAIDELLDQKGFSSQMYLYKEAKEEVIKSGVLENYQYIHFATHGFVNDEIPEYSGVFLSQNQDSDEDCILFASEIYGLNINADLVALSACETGMGQFAIGEGIVGLTRAFLFAGAKNLLVSQWQVSDESTARLMVDFYKHVLSGSDKSKALREAKLALIKDPMFSAPYYWAPFVLIGR